MREGLREYIRHVRMISRNAQLFLLGGFCAALTGSVALSLRNLYFEEIGFTRDKIAYFASMELLGIVLVAIPTALIITRIRPKIAFPVAALLIFAGNIGQLTSCSFWQILAWNAVLGVAGGFISLSMAPLYMRSSSPAERSYVFGLHYALPTAVGVGMTLLAGQIEKLLTGGFLVSSASGLRWVLIGSCGGVLIAVIPYLLIRDSELSNADEVKSFRITKIRNKAAILKVCIPEFLIGAGSGLFIPFVNLYFKTRLGASPSEVSNYYAAGRAATMVGYFIAPIVAKRLGLLRSIVMTELLSLPFLIALALLFNPYVVISAYVVRQTLMNISNPNASNFAMEIMPPEEQAIANSIKLLVWNGGRALFAVFAGWMLNGVKDGFRYTLIGTAVLYFAAAVAFILLFRKHPLYHAPEAAEN